MASELPRFSFGIWGPQPDRAVSHLRLVDGLATSALMDARQKHRCERIAHQNVERGRAEEGRV